MSIDFLGKGLKYPLKFQSISGGTEVSTVTSSSQDKIHESIIQILGTQPGERFMNPQFGSRLKELVFDQNDDALRSLIRHYVIDGLARWEKRIAVTAVDFNEDGSATDTNLLLVRISYRIIRTQTEGNLVYPFYRESGL